MSLLGLTQKIASLPRRSVSACGNRRLTVMTNPSAVLTMGRGDQGQLMCDVEQRFTPDSVHDLEDRITGHIVHVAASTFHTAVTTSMGEILVAGNNEDGQLAAESKDSRITHPRHVSALESQAIVSVAAGDSHTACVNSNGQVITFGSNEFGQLGHKCSHASEECHDGEVYRRPPRVMSGLGKVRAVQVTCGDDFTVVLGSAGEVYSVGNGVHGCLGQGDRASRTEATRVAALVGIPCTQVAAGSIHVVATTVTGLAYAWGRNKSGRLGIPIAEVPHAAYTPRRVTALPELVQQVACGDDHTVFVSRTGRAFVAGCGSRGQLGLPLPAPDSSSSLPPDNTGMLSPSGTRHPLSAVEVPTLLGSLEGFPIRQVACGRSYTMFLLQSGMVVACGANDSGQAGLDTGVSASSSVAVSSALGSAPDTIGRPPHAASALALGISPPFRESDVPYPTIVPGLSERGVFCLGAGSEHTVAVRVTRGSVLSTPPGSMPRGSMAFVDATSLISSIRWAMSSGGTGPLRRMLREVFSNVSSLNGSFLRSAPEDFKLIEVRAPGAPSIVQSFRNLPAWRFPRLLDGAGVVAKARMASSAAAKEDAPEPARPKVEEVDEEAFQPASTMVFEGRGGTRDVPPSTEPLPEAQEWNPALALAPKDYPGSPPRHTILSVAGSHFSVMSPKPLKEPPPPPTYPLEQLSSPTMEDDAIVPTSPRSQERAIALAGGPFPTPRVVLLYPEFRIVGAGTPFPAVAQVAEKLQSSGLDIPGLELAYRALFGQGGEEEKDQDDASAAAPGPSRGAHPSLPFVLHTMFEAVTALMVEVRGDVSKMTEPDSIRFLLILLLCPMLAHGNQYSAELVVRISEAILSLPPSSQKLFFEWIAADVPPVLFASRVLGALQAQLNAFVSAATSGRTTAEVCPGVSYIQAMELSTRLLKLLFSLNERVAAKARAEASFGKLNAPKPAPVGPVLGPHVATCSGPPAGGVFGLGMMDPVEQVAVEEDNEVEASAAASAAAASSSSSASSRIRHGLASSHCATCKGVPLAPGVTRMTYAPGEEGDAKSETTFAFEIDQGVDEWSRLSAGIDDWLAETARGEGGVPDDVHQRGQPLTAEELETRAWGLVHFSAFYNRALSELPDPVLHRHYDRWRMLGYRDPPGELSLCSVPFLLSADAKRRILQHEALLQQSREAHNAMARALLFGAGSPYLVLEVRRDRILSDTLTRLSSEHPQSLKRPLKVVFAGEEGVDAGGVTREFFALAIAELFDERFAMFERLSSGKYMFNSRSLEASTEFRLAGLLCGLAIYNSTVLDLQFPTAIYRKLLGQPVDLFDLTEVRPELGRGLQQLLAYEGEDVEDVFCLDFSISEDYFGSTRTIELVPGGADKPVTSSNKGEYVTAVCDYYLNKAVEEQFKAFAHGFLSVADGPALHLFRSEELSQLVSGQGFLDFDALREATLYEGGYGPDHPQIRRFWRVVKSMTDEQRRKLLLFATGASRAPIGGLSKLDPPFKLQRNGPDTDRLPTASTCFHTLLLPEYATEDKLRDRLLVAIEECRGFGLQ
jgi:ubiquitin-protein ligase E3 A